MTKKNNPFKLPETVKGRTMKLLIDADGCPVVDISVKIASDYGLRCIILCDTAHVFERGNAETLTVSKGADSVDFKLVNLLDEGDIVVTQDYGLAAMCLAKGAHAINQNGLVYNASNIDSLLNSRYESKKIRAAGGRTKGPQKRRPEQNKKFEYEFNRLCGELCGNQSR